MNKVRFLTLVFRYDMRFDGFQSIIYNKERVIAFKSKKHFIGKEPEEYFYFE